MSQNDLAIANQGFASFRTDLNSALQALGSTNSGTSAPSTTYANMLWYDATNNILKIRNEANDAFISLFTLDQTNDNIESLTINGNLTADALIVDNITIDGTEIDLSSGDLTVDVAGNIFLNADGGDVRLVDGDTQFGVLQNNSTDFVIQSSVSDKDIIFRGNDASSGIEAMRLDMSDAGTAIFGHDLKVADNNNMQFGSGPDLMLSSDGTNGTIENQQSNGDIIFKGSDAGSTITALTLDMSSAGKAIFNSGLAIGGTGDANTLSDYEEGTFTPAPSVGTVSSASGEYTKIGRLVSVRIKLATGFDTTTDAVQLIQGLPFTTSSADRAIGSAMMNQTDNANRFGTAYIDSNSKIQLYSASETGAFDAFRCTDLNSSNAGIYISATYETAS